MSFKSVSDWATVEQSRRVFLRRAALAISASAVPSLLSACATGEGTGTTARDSLRFLVSEPFWADWNPYGHTAVISYKVNANVFERLVEMNPDLTLRPGLAETWQQVDATSWEFKLRRGVKFHDGQEFGAADVKASIELASGTVDPDIMSAGNWVPFRVQVVDDRTVLLESAEEFGPLLNLLAITDIVSAADVEGGVEGLAAKPNGTGPFKLRREDTNVKVFARHDAYHGARPPLREMTWEYIQDGQTRVNALLGGQAEIIDRVEPDQFGLLEGSDAVELTSQTSTETQFLEMRTDRAPFDRVELRQAVAWAVDRGEIAALVGGEATRATSFWAPTVAYHQEQEPQYSRDLDRARERFAAGDGASAGQIELVVSTGFFPKSAEIGELVRQNLEEVGFEVKLTLVELAAWLDLLLGDEKKGHLFHGGWTTMFPDPDRAVRTLYYGPFSATGWQDSRTDELIDAGRLTTDDRVRGDVYAQLQARLWEQIPHLPLMHSDLSDSQVVGLQRVDRYPNFLHTFTSASVGG